jgi:lysophospholipase L1-like esterase
MNTLRLIFFSLFLILSLSKTAFAQVPFAAEILKFTQADSATPPVAGQIVLYGSSTLRFWKTAETDFALGTLKVINRGFGGSQTVDALRYFEQVIVPHRPKYLFFYEGDNDVNAGKSVDSVFQEMALFIKKVRQALPDTRLVIFSIKPSPSRLTVLEKQQELNKRLKKRIKPLKKVYYVDVATPMLDASGKPKRELFIQDMLHMKPEGYVLWTKEVQKFLQKHR